MADQSEEQGAPKFEAEQAGKDRKERVPEGEYLGIPAAKLHQFRWPLNPHKGTRLPLVPMEYLMAFTKHAAPKHHQEYWNIAKAELSRRSSDPELKRVTFTEHVFERFTQLFPTAVIKVQNLCHKQHSIGAITIMKLWFLKALDAKEPVKTAKGNDNYRIERGLFRWTYGIYYQDSVKKTGKFYKIISVYPARSTWGKLRLKRATAAKAASACQSQPVDVAPTHPVSFDGEWVAPSSF